MSNKNDITVKTKDGLVISGFASEAQAFRAIRLVQKDSPISLPISPIELGAEDVILPSTVNKSKKMKCGRANTHVVWTEEENRFMEENFDLGPSALRRVPFLRERHTPLGVSTHYYNMKYKKQREAKTTE